MKNHKYDTTTFQQKNENKNTQWSHDFIICLEFDT